MVTTMRDVIAIRDISSSEASPMLLLTRSRMRSDSLKGWFRLPRPNSNAPACPIPDSDLTRTWRVGRRNCTTGLSQNRA